MGYTTDFIGHIEIHPRLNDAEQSYLTAFTASRRYRRADGPYDVPGNPAAEADQPSPDIDAYNTIGQGQPSLWCGWQPSPDGGCLAFDGQEKFYDATRWMTYLIDHFLAADAWAQQTGLSWFTDFTFDHTLQGVIACSPRDTHELYLIRVTDNVVREEPLWLPTPELAPAGLLPYEAAIDAEYASSRRQRPGARRPGRADAN
jgi:hypothetical protein